MSFLDNLKETTTEGYTENGAKTFTSTLNHNLDLYAQAGAIRSRLDDAGMMFSRAYSEDKGLALRNLSYLRDVRGGLGERQAFRNMANTLIEVDPKVAMEYLEYVPMLGRWDDLVEMYYHAKITGVKEVAMRALIIMSTQLYTDLGNMQEKKEISLLAKWLPSPSVKNKRRKKQANMLAKDLGLSVRDLRQTLSAMRKYIEIVETKLTEKNYDAIDFEKLPSRALFKYRSSFQRNMTEEYENFIDRVSNGEVKMNASNVLPYEIIKNYFDYQGWGGHQLKEFDKSLEATWKSLDDTIGECEESAIVVADTSGSMMGDPWYVAQSLAIYSAERLKGPFANHFITFSNTPQLIELPKQGTLRDKMSEYNKHSIIQNTDIEAVFKLILGTAVKNNTPQSELPTKIIIVSDMEFDYMTNNSDVTVFEGMKKMYAKAGYQMPNVVFWNVKSSSSNTPVRHNEQGVALVSGLTPNIFKQVLLKDFISPEGMMLETLMSERYDFVEKVLK